MQNFSQAENKICKTFCPQEYQYYVWNTSYATEEITHKWRRRDATREQIVSVSINLIIRPLSIEVHRSIWLNILLTAR
jgi:hypothetical protein